MYILLVPLNVESVIMNKCPTCGAHQSTEQKDSSLHCYTRGYDCGYEIIHSLSDSEFIEVSVACGGEEYDQPRRFFLFSTRGSLSALQAVAESWASIDGKTPIYTSNGLKEGLTYPDGKPVTYASINDYADGYESDASELIRRIEKRGYKIVQI